MLQNFSFSFKREGLGAEKCRDQGTKRLRKEKKGTKTVVKGGIGEGGGWLGEEKRQEEIESVESK